MTLTLEITINISKEKNEFLVVDQVHIDLKGQNTVMVTMASLTIGSKSRKYCISFKQKLLKICQQCKINGWRLLNRNTRQIFCIVMIAFVIKFNNECWKGFWCMKYTIYGIFILFQSVDLNQQKKNETWVRQAH